MKPWTHVVICSLMAVNVMSTYAAAASTKSLSSDWQFTPANDGKSYAVAVGFNLADQLPHQVKTSGHYDDTFALPTTSPETQWSDPLAMWIPAIGGRARIAIDGNQIPIPTADYSSVGPLILLPRFSAENDVHTLRISVDAPRTTLSGLWKGGPVIGPFSALDSLRNRSAFEQRTQPLVVATIMLGLTLLFLWVFGQTGRRFEKYLALSEATATWALFYFVLSGVPRGWDFALGTILIYPTRILTFSGLFVLIASHSGEGLSKYRPMRLGFLAAAIVDLILGILQAATAQKLFYVTAGLASWWALSTFRGRKLSKLQLCVLALSVIALAGQTADSIKLCDWFLRVRWPLPYLNRWTFGPLFLTSIAIYVHQFSDYFYKQRRQMYRARANARAALRLTTFDVDLHHSEAIGPAVRRAMGVGRFNMSVRTENGTYEVAAVSGISESALGSKVRIDQFPEMLEAVKTGKITFGSVDKHRGPQWKTRSFACVPLPLSPNPELLILLSDPVGRPEFTAEDRPYLSQLAATIWANLQRTQEAQRRQQIEQKFRKIVANLEPNLYEFIEANLNAMSPDRLAPAAERAIGYFDQKLYSTLLESLPTEEAEKLANDVALWVAKATMRFHGRIKAFYGDCFIVECLSFGSEGAADAATRLVSILWHLVETLPELNSTLMRRNVGPINFRFGAHFGAAAEIKLSFIEQTHTSLVGDAVNVSARVQSEAEPGAVFLSEPLVRLVSSRFIVEAVPRKFVKGREGEVPLFRVIAKRIEVSEAGAAA